MALIIELLGRPRLVRGDGEMPVPRGRKTWSLLAYLLLASRPPSRSRLGEVLFGDADDPLGALRWSLSDLRRLLGEGCEVAGDPVTVMLPTSAVVDTEILRRGRWEEAVDLPGLGRPLLEGVAVTESAAFEIWLDNERRGLDGAAEAALHEAALVSIGVGEADAAVGYGTRLVELNPWDEANHELFVQCLRSAGDPARAVEHVERCAEMFRRELGVEPSAALTRAATAPLPDASDPLSDASGPRPHSVMAMVDAGEAAMGAGAIKHGLRTLREAAQLARGTDDGHLAARALVALGDALVNAGHGGDEEGGAVLHEAAMRADEAGDDLLASAAYRTLAYADLQRGRYERAEELAAAAWQRAGTDDAELAWIESIQGTCLSDQGRHTEAFVHLTSGVGRAARAEAREAEIFAGSWVGRLHLLRGELTEAAEVLDEVLGKSREHWTLWVPVPESLLAEVEFLRGNLGAAEAGFEHAFVLARQFDDPCLESISTRGLGIVAVAKGEVDRGYRLLVDAPRYSRRSPDSYRWIEGYGLDALCATSIDHEMAAAPRWVADLEALAARCGMRELLARAMLHRARLGEPAAHDAAAELISTIDNPALQERLAVATS